MTYRQDWLGTHTAAIDAAAAAQQAVPVTQDYLVGRMLCGAFRSGLNRLRFRSEPIDWIESSGWIQRVFTVKAPATTHAEIAGWIASINKEST